MLFRPISDDLRLIATFTGRAILGVGVAMLVPAAYAATIGERNDAYGLVIGAALAVITGALSELTLRPVAAQRRAGHGLAAVALSWTLAPLFAAVPLLLSGHWATFLDAYFEAVSGFTTTGLTLVNDLDHLSASINLWRTMTQLIGGQSIIIVVMVVFSRGMTQTGALTPGDDDITPGTSETIRFLARLGLTYGGIGIALLWTVLLAIGMRAGPALYDAASLFMSAFDTGGFTPHAASIAFYRSPAVELIVAVLSVAGALSMALHYELWRGRRRELIDHVETRTLALTLIVLFAIATIGLGRTGTFVDVVPLFRHGFFQILSAQTTTGFTTLPGRLFSADWGELAPAMLVTAMAIGAMAGSSAGGIKAVRMGLLLKGLRREVRRVLLPENALVVETYHARTRRVLSSDEVRDAATVLLLYVLLYLAGGILGVFYGYDLDLALFDSTAAASSTALSVGVLRPGLEWPLKSVFLAQMIIGRLEFVAVFALAGYIVALVRGRA